MKDVDDRRKLSQETGDGDGNSQRYGRVAIALHWLIASAILFQIGLGWSMAKLKGLPSFNAFQLHKSIGIAVLILSVARLGWRLGHTQPSPIHQPLWMQRAATLVHVGFYAIMIGIPLSGWIMVSTAKIDIPTLLFHSIPWPHLPIIHGLSVAAKQPWFQGAKLTHSILVYATLALLALHIGGVLKHQLLDRDAVLDKMAPGSRPGWLEPRMWLAFALLAGVFIAGGRLYLSGTTAPPLAGTPHQPAARNSGVAPSVAAAPAAGQTAPSANESSNVSVPSAAETAATPTTVDPVSWQIAAETSKLAFTAFWSGQPINGNFDKWSGEIRFSPDALDRSTIRIDVDLASAATGDIQRDSSLPTADWFDVPEHPKAVWTSAKITRTGNDHYHASGTLQLRGIAKPLGLDFSLKIVGKRANVSGSTMIDRVRYGVGQGQWAATDQIAKNVALTFTVDAIRK